MQAVIYVVLSVCAIFIIISMLRTKRFFTALLLTVLQGVTALFAADLIAESAGIQLSVNAYTLAICALGGIPAVTFLLLLGVILR